MTDAGTASAPRSRVRWRGVAAVRRTLLACFVFGQTLVACYYLLWVLPYHGETWLELAILGLFAVLYAWIAVGFWVAVFGFVLRLFGVTAIPCCGAIMKTASRPHPWPARPLSCRSTTSRCTGP